MSTLRPDIAREFGDNASNKPEDDSTAALNRNADHVPADDSAAEPATSKEALEEMVRRQDEAGKD